MSLRQLAKIKGYTQQGEVLSINALAEITENILGYPQNSIDVKKYDTKKKLEEFIIENLQNDRPVMIFFSVNKYTGLPALIPRNEHAAIISEYNKSTKRLCLNHWTQKNKQYITTLDDLFNSTSCLLEKRQMEIYLNNKIFYNEDTPKWKLFNYFDSTAIDEEIKKFEGKTDLITELRKIKNIISGSKITSFNPSLIRISEGNGIGFKNTAFALKTPPFEDLDRFDKKRVEINAYKKVIEAEDVKNELYIYFFDPTLNTQISEFTSAVKTIGYENGELEDFGQCGIFSPIKQITIVYIEYDPYEKKLTPNSIKISNNIKHKINPQEKLCINICGHGRPATNHLIPCTGELYITPEIIQSAIKELVPSNMNNENVSITIDACYGASNTFYSPIHENTNKPAFAENVVKKLFDAKMYYDIYAYQDVIYRNLELEIGKSITIHKNRLPKSKISHLENKLKTLDNPNFFLNNSMVKKNNEKIIERKKETYDFFNKEIDKGNELFHNGNYNSIRKVKYSFNKQHNIIIKSYNEKDISHNLTDNPLKIFFKKFLINLKSIFYSRKYHNSNETSLTEINNFSYAEYKLDKYLQYFSTNIEDIYVAISNKKIIKILAFFINNMDRETVNEVMQNTLCNFRHILNDLNYDEAYQILLYITILYRKDELEAIYDFLLKNQFSEEIIFNYRFCGKCHGILKINRIGRRSEGRIKTYKCNSCGRTIKTRFPKHIM